MQTRKFEVTFYDAAGQEIFSVVINDAMFMDEALDDAEHRLYAVNKAAYERKTKAVVEVIQ